MHIADLYTAAERYRCGQCGGKTFEVKVPIYGEGRVIVRPQGELEFLYEGSDFQIDADILNYADQLWAVCTHCGHKQEIPKERNP